MNTETIDSALSELLQLRWKWEYEERSAERTRQIEEHAAQLAATAPGIYADIAKSLVEEMKDAPPLDPPPLFVPPPARDEETEAPLTPVETLLADLPVDWESDVEPDVEQLLTHLPETEPPPVRTRLPLRNATTSTASHVQLFTEHGGLVHGGVVTIGESRLVCRAFSWFRHTATPRKLFGKFSAPGTTERVHAVAGVCEQFDSSGAVVNRLSTAKQLTDVYRTTSQPLLDGAWRAAALLGTGEGFYVTALTRDAVLRVVRGGNVVLPDTGVPDPRVYGDNFFARSFGPNASPENALFDKRAVGTDGWVIKTPYLAVYAPDPRLVAPRPSLPYVPVIVAMLGVFRRGEWTTVRSKKKLVTTTKFERESEWTVRSFKLPLPD